MFQNLIIFENVFMLILPSPFGTKKTNFFCGSSKALKELKYLNKTFGAKAKNCDNENLKLIFILIQLSEMHVTGRIKVYITSVKNAHNLVVHRMFTVFGRQGH